MEKFCKAGPCVVVPVELNTKKKAPIILLSDRSI